MRSSSRQTRKFSIIDMMILAASTTPVFLWLWLVSVFELMPFIGLEEGSFFGALTTATFLADPFLAAWTLAWCVLRLRGPRPPWRHLVRQPGVAVGLVAIIGWSIGGIVTLRWSLDVHHMPPSWIEFGVVQLASATMFGGFGVFVAWAGIALDGRWRPEKSWVDRMGRALGVCWIALGVPSGILLKTFTMPYY